MQDQWLPYVDKHPWYRRFQLTIASQRPPFTFFLDFPPTIIAIPNLMIIGENLLKLHNFGYYMSPMHSRALMIMETLHFKYTPLLVLINGSTFTKCLVRYLMDFILFY